MAYDVEVSGILALSFHRRWQPSSSR